MKFLKYTILPLSLIALNANAETSKQMTLPFNHEVIFAKDHNALTFNYDLSGNPAKKIVCKVSDAYKVWFEFPIENTIRESGTYGDYQTVIFKSSGHNSEPNDETSIYRADMKGTIKINEVDNQPPHTATATCYYANDNTNN